MNKQYLYGALACFVFSVSAYGQKIESKNVSQATARKTPVVTMPHGDNKKIAMVMVPAGEFIMGSDRVDSENLQKQYGIEKPIFVDEHPQQKMYLDTFMIDTYEVSNIQFKEFILGTGRLLPYEWGHNGYGLTMEEAARMKMDRLRKIGAEDFKLDMDTRTMQRKALMQVMQKAQTMRDFFPVTGISWDYANEYCKWRGQRLPTEAEWEKAARGPTGLEYPWGNEWNIAKTNTGDDNRWEEGYAPVGAYPQNSSPYGAYDMGGNVWEWTASWYDRYPGSTLENADFGQKFKVIRGGAGSVGHYALSYFFRGATRQTADPQATGEDLGFRCVMDVAQKAD
ncbi:MAG: SUMF1/EgtB/PvdO family nonheme iron enzyme [Pseudomonadota bacterium]